MAKPAVWPLLAVLFAALGSGCNPYGQNQFNCASNESCGAGGTCQSDGFCSFDDPLCPNGRYGDHSGDRSGECVDVDAGVPPDMAPQTFCYGSPDGLVRPCFAADPTGMLRLNAPIDTDSSELCTATVSPVAACVIAADQIQINGGDTVTATGKRPLVLVAKAAVVISGTIDVASHRVATAVGAGGNPMGLCDAGTLPTAARSGGAGGSFGDLGGNGGNPGQGIAGAVSAAGLRGGCRGQDGVAGQADAARRGIGGNGGGAIYLIAGSTLTINGGGRINASGAGGTGGLDQESGGGGGGSGGLIGLDAPTVTNNGTLFANGGGGGGGSGTGGAGGPGQDPTGVGEAPGGSTGAGGDGGQGGASADPTGDNGGPDNQDGTGGGGGGVGVIRVFPPQALGGSVSPAPS